MLRPLRPFAARVCLSAVLVSLVPADMQAAVLNWINPAGGLASLAVHWSPAQVPTASDDLRFDTTGTYAVHFTLLVDSTASQTFRDGDVSLDFDGTHDIANALRVANGNNQVATARVVQGTLRAGLDVLVGTGNNSDGTLVVNGAFSELRQNQFPGPTKFVVGGGGGTGLLRVTGGGVVRPAVGVDVGQNGGALGTIRVRGESSSPARPSQFLMDGSLADCAVGTHGGHGVFEVLDGGLGRVQRDLLLAPAAGDSAEVLIGGRGTIDSSRLVVHGDLFVSRNADVGAGGTGGWSRLTLDSLGVLDVVDTTEIGDTDGSDALLTLHRGSRMITGSLLLRQSVGRAIDHSGGLLQVRSGVLSTGSGRFAVPGAPGDPVIELMDGATATFTGSAGLAPLEVGLADDATLRVLGGATLTANGGSPVIAPGLAASAALEVAGASFVSDSRLIAGSAGDAAVRFRDAAAVTVSGVDVASTFSSASFVSVSGGATVQSNGTVNVGGSATTQGGSGQVTVLGGGRLTIASAIGNGLVWPTGSFDVAAGGRVDLSAALTNRGAVGLFGGELAGGSLVLRGSGVLHGFGDASAAIVGSTDTTVAVVAEGDLLLGNAAAPAGFVLRGLLDVGAFDVTVRDADSAVVGRVSLAGGQLRLPAGGGVIEAGRRLTGHGTVHGPVVNRGIVTGSGGELAFRGTLFGSGEGTGADSMRFLAGGGFEGMGVLASRVRVDSGAVIRATGDLTMGLTSAQGAVTVRGRVETGPHKVSLRDKFHQPHVAGEVVLGGGALEIAPGTQPSAFPNVLFFDAGSRLTGRGEVLDTLQSSGTIEPGSSAGRIGFARDLIANAGSRVVIELGDHTAGEHDTLAVAGALRVAGSTLELRRLPTFAASAGDSFRVIEYGSHAAPHFGTVTLDGQPIDGQMEVHYDADGVWIVALQTTVAVGDEPRPAVGALRFGAVGSPGPRAGLELALPAETDVRVELFDLVGRRIATLHDGVLGAGRHRLEVPGGLRASGLLFARAEVGTGAARVVRTTKVVRTR